MTSKTQKMGQKNIMNFSKNGLKYTRLLMMKETEITCMKKLNFSTFCNTFRRFFRVNNTVAQTFRQILKFQKLTVLKLSKNCQN